MIYTCKCTYLLFSFFLPSSLHLSLSPFLPSTPPPFLPHPPQIVGVWPFDSLRRYWCGDGIFGFEAGRRSPRGEGTYTFITRLDEDIYQTVANLISKAKRRFSDASSGSADSKDVDNRPPAPLPMDAHRSDTPPVESSESDEDPAEWTNPHPPFDDDSNDIIVDRALAYDLIETPPLPPKPKSLRHEANPSLKKPERKSATSLRQAREASDVSGTNPAYLKRSRTHTGSSPKWLHESFNPQNIDRPPSGNFARRDLPPPPVSLTGGNVRTRDPLKEDTYSHTVHIFHAPFQRSNVVGGSLYNALVHKHNPDVPRKERPHSEADTTLYDVAFLPSGTTKTATLPVRSSDYGTINVKESKDTSNIPRTKTPLTKMPLSKSKGFVPTKPLEPIKDAAESPDKTPPLSSRELCTLERSLSDEGLTVNPLYGSQENLLAQIEELDAQAAAMFDKTEEVTNPVYGDSKTVRSEEPLPGNSEGRVMEGSEATDQPDAVPLKVSSDSSQQGNQQQGSNSQPKSETGGPTSPIQRDAKGYSQVDKSKKTKALAVATRGSGGKEDIEDQAPPVPERLYSCEDEAAVTDV